MAVPEVLFLRHGKSDWNAAFAGDRERPLAERGRHAAETMGRTLTRMGRAPDLVLTSPALRARRTAELAATAGEWTAPINEMEGLYGASADAVVGSLTGVPGHVVRLLLVGHEPGWSGAVSTLIGGGSIRMVTCAVAAVEVPDWGAITTGSGRLLWMLVPRLLSESGRR